MEIINCNFFKKWVSLQNDYIFKGGKKPINHFPKFFSFYVYKNANYANTPDTLLVDQLNFPSLGLMKLVCPWNDFQYETVSTFNQTVDKVYFAKNLDYLEICNGEAVYEVNLNMNDHIGKVIFRMPNIETEEDYSFLPTRIFLPELNLTHIDSENQFQVIYSQNKLGIGIQNSEPYTKNDAKDAFLFNKPFYVEVYIDMIHLLTLLII